MIRAISFVIRRPHEALYVDLVIRKNHQLDDLQLDYLNLRPDNYNVDLRYLSFYSTAVSSWTYSCLLLLSLRQILYLSGFAACGVCA